MSKLTLIHSQKNNKVKATRRVRPDGYLQCNRCGSRTTVTVVNGAYIKNGKKQGGTVIVKDICFICYQHNIISPMIGELKPVK